MSGSPPAISYIPDQSLGANSITPYLAFSVVDAETPSASLVVSGASSNTVLVPNNRITFTTFSGGTNRLVRITPATNQIGTTLITLTVTDTAAEKASTSFLLTVTNGAPTISAISDRVINAGITSAAISFVVFDKETPPSNLVVQGSSLDTNLIRNGSFFFGSSGSNRTVKILPEMKLGTSAVSLTVADVFGATASNSFYLTITNTKPVIPYPGTLLGIINQPSPQAPFTVSDLESAASNLVVTAYSSNTTLVADENIFLSGGGSNRWVSVVPEPNQVGKAVINLVVADQLGGRATNQLTVTISQFGEVTNLLPGCSDSSIAWADYDRDGKLDFAVMGYGPATNIIFRSLGGGAFTNIGANLLGLYLGALAWADYDSDEDLDLAVSGYTQDGQPATRLYRNDSGAFTAVPTTLPALYYSGLAWGDYDNDGDPDLLIGGISNSIPITQLFRNDHGQLVDSGILLPRLYSVIAAWGDYDNDGDLDLLLSGRDAANRFFGRVYRNAGNDHFVNTAAALFGMGSGSASWGDYDGDGDLDILLHGAYNVGDGYTKVFRNEGGDQFVEVDVGMSYSARKGAAWGDYDNDGDLDIVLGHRYETFGNHFYRNDGGYFFDSSNSISGLGFGALAWGDFDNDGRLDLLQTGEKGYPGYGRATRLFRNYGPVTNSPPVQPGGLAAVVSGRTVQLSWNPTTDPNQATSLTYNLRVGTAPGSGNILNPQSLADGLRMVPAHGNVLLNRRWWLRDLVPGTYYAAVQAVDAGYLGSSFSSEIAFVIQASPGAPSALTEAATGITYEDAILNGVANPNGLGATAWFEFGTTTNYGAQTGVLSIGGGTNDLSVSLVATGLVAVTEYHTRLVVANSAGTNRGPDRTFTTREFATFTEVFGVLPEVSLGNALWGDYDADGDQDLFTPSAILRNQSGVFVDSGISGLSGGLLGDLNRDNRIDLLPTEGSTNAYLNVLGTSFVLNPLPITLPFYAYEAGNLAWGDYDNDTDLDVLVVRSTYAYTLLYRNDHGASFNRVTNGLPHATKGAPAWFDYDNDGRLDLFLSYFQFVASGHAQLFHNDGNESFTNSGVMFTNVSARALDWADYDNDGDLDLVIADGPYSSGPIRIFVNEGNGSYAESSVTNLPNGSIARWGDYDNNGTPDLLITRTYGNVWVCRNNAGNFEVQEVAAASRISHASWSDYDKDGDLDILVGGEGNGYQGFTRMLRNNGAVSNSPPSAPSALSAALEGKAVRLSWGKPTDANQTNGWSNNLRVGTAPGGYDVVSPLADLATGYRRLLQFGNAGVGTNWVLTNLPVGTYYWSVQAVDHSFSGSPFAAEASFVIPPWPPDILAAWSTNPTLTSVTLAGLISPNDRTTTVWFEYGLTTNYTDVSATRLIPAVNGEVITNVLLNGLSPLTTYNYRMVASNNLGVVYGPNQTFVTLQFTEMPSPFTLTDTWRALWADLDTDGILDVAIAGTIGGGVVGHAYHNDSAGGFSLMASNLSYGTFASSAFAMDRDNDVDLAMPGNYYPLYVNDGLAHFSNSTNSLGFMTEVILPADVDNDGDNDLFVAGYYDSPTSGGRSILFTNNGSGVFSDSQLPFIQSRTAVAAWADTDADGDFDLALCGNAGSNSTNFSRLYRNDGPLGFTAMSDVFNPVGGGSMCWSDYDNDGDMDMFLTGSGTNGLQSRLYRCDGPNIFTEIDAGIVGVYKSSAEWGDFDNDGLPDLMITGYLNAGLYTTRMYRNLGGDHFESLSANLRGSDSGNATWGDYDRDGDLDILITSRYAPATLYRNNALSSNAIPAAPGNLASLVINGNSARLSWTPSVDANQIGGHTFNLRVGTAPGSNDVMNALAVWPVGTRRVGGLGNVQLATNWTIKALLPGTYYWSVQQVDHSHAGSPFAAEQSFTVLPFAQPPGLTAPSSTNVEFFTAELRGLVNPFGVASTAWAEYGLTTNYGSITLAQPVGVGTNWVNFSQAISNLTDNVTYHWRLVGSNVNGVTYGLDQTLTTLPYVLFTAKAQLLPFANGSVAWGDYDNDGDLDLLVTGLAYEFGSGSTTRCRVYRNDDGDFNLAVLIPAGSYHGDANWGDYDNDGDLDIVVTGNSDQYGNMTRVYRNDGSNTFTYVPLSLPAVYLGRTAWADLDRDGDLDLVVASSTGTTTYRNDGHTFVQHAALQSFAALGVADIDSDGDQDLLLKASSGAGAVFYLNDGAGNFTVFNTGLPILSAGAIDFADSDNDGDLDLALIGNRTTSPTTYLSQVLRNDGVLSFTDLGAGVPGAQYSCCAWGDYDNDGDADFLFNGYLNGGPGVTMIYRNDGGGTFSDSGAVLEPTYEGQVAWGDYDNDGDLDLVATGSGYTRVYRNNATNANARPLPPSGLAATPIGNAVTFSWLAPADSNQSGGLTYNVRVGTVPGTADVLGPMADLVTGFRRVPKLGNAGALTWLVLTNLPSGTYYWSVQAVDHSLAGSEFAPESQFVIVPRAPDALTGVATNMAITTATLTGYSAPNGAATEAWFEYSAGGVANSTMPQPIGDGFGLVPVTAPVADLYPGTLYRYRLVASNAMGVTYGNVQSFIPPMFTEMATPFDQVKSGSLMWGDYDGDGDLDLALTGDSSNIVNSTVSRIYRNNGNSTFTDINSTITPAVTPANWGDYDNDGDLDLLLLTRLHRNEGGTFTLLSNGLPQLSYPATAWGDFDNDGRLDILFAGFAGGSGTTSRVTQIYRNLGSGVFTNSGISMQGVENPSVAWGDYDNDGDLDVLRTGFNTGGVRDTRIYRNNGNGTFSSLAVFMLPGVTHGSGVWGDCDNDGDLDILLTGETSSNRITKVFINEGGDVFSDSLVELPGVAFGDAIWADYDNDGDLDILLTGHTGTNMITKIYRQDGFLQFLDSQISLPALTDSTAAWGDYDNDGDLDLVLQGYAEGSVRVTQLFRNNCRVTNPPPSAPGGLSTTVVGNSVRFEWAAASDANQIGGLTYNLRVGTAPGSEDRVGGMADRITGLRRVVRLGNAQCRTSWTITNLPPATYHWSVQAIDHSFAGSAFASEASVLISNHLPIAYSQTNVLAEDTPQPITLSGFDPDTQALSYTLMSSCSNGVLIGTPPDLLYRPASNFFGIDGFSFVIHDGLTNSAVAAVSLIITQVWDVLSSSLALHAPSGGLSVLSLNGEPFERYQIQASSDLVHWTDITNVSSSDGLVSLLLADVTLFPKRFYRAALELPRVSLQSARLVPQEGFSFDFTGQPARIYAIQASSNLINWTSLTNLLLVNSPTTFTDTSSAGLPWRFYRVIPVP